MPKFSKAMKQRSFFAFLAVSAVTLLLLGAGAFYGLLGQTAMAVNTSGTASTPAATLFVPKTVPMMVSLLVNPDRVETLQQSWANPFKRQRSHAVFNRIKHILLANTDLNYRRDIRPWLANEVTLALMSSDVDRNLKNGEQPGYLFALATKDSQRSRDALEQFWKGQVRSGAEVVLEPYKGVPLTYRKQQQSNESGNLATAILNRFVLIANSPKVLREAINNVQAQSLSLSQSPVYQRALAQLEPDRIGLAFLNLGSWGLNWTDVETSVAAQPSLAVSVGLHSEGLLADTALLTATAEEGESVAPVLSQPISAMQYLPAPSTLAIAGNDLNQLWLEFSAIVSGNPGLEGLVNQPLEVLQTLWGLDIPQDLFSWVRSEYALALVPRPDQPQPDWVFVTTASPQSQAALTDLDAIATNQGYSVGTFELEEHQLSAWTKLMPITLDGDENNVNTRILKAEAKGVHAQVGNYEILTTSVEAMDNALAAAKTGTILDNPEFQTSLSQLPQTNNGYFFLNWESSQGILKQQVPLLRLVELSAQPFFDHLRSLTISNTGKVDGVSKSTVFVRLK